MKHKTGKIITRMRAREQFVKAVQAWCCGDFDLSGRYARRSAKIMGEPLTSATSKDLMRRIRAAASSYESPVSRPLMRIDPATWERAPYVTRELKPEPSTKPVNCIVSAKDWLMAALQRRSL